MQGSAKTPEGKVSHQEEDAWAVGHQPMGWQGKATFAAATVFCPLFKFEQKTRSTQQREAPRLSLVVGKVRAGSDTQLVY